MNGLWIDAWHNHIFPHDNSLRMFPFKELSQENALDVCVKWIWFTIVAATVAVAVVQASFEYLITPSVESSPAHSLVNSSKYEDDEWTISERLFMPVAQNIDLKQVSCDGFCVVDFLGRGRDSSWGGARRPEDIGHICPLPLSLCPIGNVDSISR